MFPAPAADALQQLAKALAPLVTDQLRRGGTSVERRLLSVPAAAEYLGRSEEAVRHLVRTRKIHAVRADGRILIDKRDLDFWIDANKR